MIVIFLALLFFAISFLGLFRSIILSFITLCSLIYMIDMALCLLPAASASEQPGYQRAASDTELNENAKARLGEALRNRDSSYIPSLKRAMRPQVKVENLQGCMNMADSPAKLACLNRNLPPERSTGGTSRPNTEQTFSSNDLSLMHETYRKNQARFFRDFGGRRFVSSMTLNSVDRGIINEQTYDVAFGEGFFGEVSCNVADRATIDMLTNQNKGDVLQVSGRIKDHMLGRVQLMGCVIGTP